MPAKVSNAVQQLDKQGSANGTTWLPLTMALEWAATHPEAAPSHPGPALLHELFAALTTTQVPAAPGFD